MWKRNLLFIGLVLGAAATLWAELLPPRIALPGSRSIPATAPDPGEIDDEIVARVNEAFRGEWSNQGFASARRASELGVFRRLTLALKGTIPSLEEIRRFEARPPRAPGRPRARGLVARPAVRRLLRRAAGPRFCRHRGWSVLALPPASVRRLVERRADAEPALRRLGARPDRRRGDLDRPARDQLRERDVRPGRETARSRTAGRADARAFLGVRLDCAQCHDHPFQSWKRQDFQGLAAFFGQVHNSLTGFRDDGKKVYEMTDHKTGKPMPVPRASRSCPSSCRRPALRGLGWPAG